MFPSWTFSNGAPMFVVWWFGWYVVILHVLSALFEIFIHPKLACSSKYSNHRGMFSTVIAYRHNYWRFLCFTPRAKAVDTHTQPCAPTLCEHITISQSTIIYNDGIYTLYGWDGHNEETPTNSSKPYAVMLGLLLPAMPIQLCTSIVISNDRVWLQLYTFHIH